MPYLFSRNRWVFPILALGLGLVLGGFLPHSPIHAVATDRCDTFLVATGPVSNEVEAVFMFDCLTGDLWGLVPTKGGNGFSSQWRYNVMNDFQLDPGSNPKFLMVTGIADFRGTASSGGVQNYLGTSLVYITELTTGKIAAYSVPWSQSQWNARNPTQATFRPVGMLPFRNNLGQPTTPPKGAGKHEK